MQSPAIMFIRKCASLILTLAPAFAIVISADQAPGPPGNVVLQQTPAWTIQPAAVTLQFGEVQDFQAFVPPEQASAVSWTASGGRVTAGGVFTAPATSGDYTVQASIGGTLRARALVKVIPPQGSSTDAADRFVDSVGVNIHLHYTDTLYAQNFDLIKQRLMELGVRHVRDGVIDTTWQPYYDRHNALGRAGIGGIFIVPPRAPDRLLLEYPTRVQSSFEGYEGPNEYDTDKTDRGWAATLRQSLAQLHGLKSVPALAAFPFYGPSLTQESSYTALGDVSASVDATTMHNYFSGRNPGTTGWGANGYGSIAWNIRVSRQLSHKPMVSTETGYGNAPEFPGSVPEAVAGRYMPRLLLEQFRNGITRTYLYELVDEPSKRQNFGLLAQDGTPKPAFRAVSALLALLSDPGLAITPRPLRYSVSGSTADLRRMVFQKRDGRYYLALWMEVPSYDVNTRRVLNVSAQQVTLAIEDTVHLRNAYAWQPDGSVTRMPLSGSTAALKVTDALQVLELGP